MKSDVYTQIKAKPEYAKYLYRYGFLITTCDEALEERCFILKSWSQTAAGRYHFWIHPEQKLFLYRQDDITFFLIGHCYNPIAKIISEERELEILASAFLGGVDAYCRELANLTGIFLTGYISNEDITLYGDAAGMFMTYYGFANNFAWIGSHAALLGDINNLKQSDYVNELVHYRFYPLFGFSLPGDLSPYDEFKRLVPNHSVKIDRCHCEIRRFYPTEDWETLMTEYSFAQRVAEITQILNSSMALIPQKWEKPAISLTGGCDSKTTLACANGSYGHYQYFSYISQEAEAIDAEGAHVICNQLGFAHSIYTIPEEPAEDQELVQQIICVNQGNIGKPNMREVQKRIFLARQTDFDVEVKSWVSEIARAYYHKRFGKRSFPASPDARYLTTLYKVFFHNRSLVRKTDAVFDHYIKTYLRQDELKNWSWLDLFFWEFRVSSWNGLVITGEHRYSGEITIPYNNRRLLTLLMAVPVEARIEDGLYQAVRTYANAAVDGAGVQITNMKHTANRAKIERLYLELHARFPW
ncbi:MAG: hypothetical protein SPE18_08340 [Candidatus Limivicinus sp.]|nr:hypothetical protein [Candidatus Limivicinus sp.]